MTAQLRLAWSADEVRPAQGPAGIFAAPVHFFGRSGTVVAETEPDGIADHVARYGPRPRSDDLITALERSGLDGRGGGHFPVARKWAAVRESVSRSRLPAIVVANGAEGEPFSAKDAALLRFRPHLVLDGLAIAAQAVGADRAIVWLHDDPDRGNQTVRAAVRAALAERRTAGIADPHTVIRSGPDRYLTGESSAIVRALSGGPALPEFRRSPSATAGVDGRPTLVHNAETLARIALLARDPSESRARSGTGSVLLTVAVEDRRTVVEAAPDQTLGGVVAAVLGPVPFQAVLLGGFGGSWTPWAHVADLPVDEAAFRAEGLSLGAGVVAPLTDRECGLAQAAHIARYLADQGARQCGPCLFGLPALAELVEDVAAGSVRRRDLARLRAVMAQVEGRGACHHPDGAVRMVASALRTFDADVHAHLRGECLHAQGRVRRARLRVGLR